MEQEQNVLLREVDIKNTFCSSDPKPGSLEVQPWVQAEPCPVIIMTHFRDQEEVG